MNGWRGSLTIEAALVVPLVLALFAFAMKSGIQMYTECRDTALAIGQEQEIEAVKMFYRWQEAGELFKMKIQYIRKLTASYMVLAQCEELQEWEKKMIAHAPKGNIVFAECVQENGESICGITLQENRRWMRCWRRRRFPMICCAMYSTEFMRQCSS